MIEIIQQGSIIRVWLNEPPPDTTQGALTLEHAVGPTSTPKGTLRRAGLEIQQHRDISSYGLLGAEMLPDDMGQLLLRLPIETEQPDVSWTLRHGSHTQYRDIPEEYGRAIIDGVTAHPSWPLLGSGVLSFGWAAHNLARSSYVVFRWLGWGLVQLLLHGHPATTELEISALLRLGTRPIWKDPASEGSA